MLLCDVPHTVSKHAEHVPCVAGTLVSPSVAKIAGSSKGFDQHGTHPCAAPPAAVMMLLCCVHLLCWDAGFLHDAGRKVMAEQCVLGGAV